MHLTNINHGVPIYHLTDTDSDISQWDKRYKELDLTREQNSRRQNKEYIDFVKRSLKITGIADKNPRKDLSVLELACGSGPLGAELISLGYSVHFCDYSKVIVERIRKEFGYKAFVADSRNLNFAKDGAYDVVLLVGVVYNIESYNAPEEFYAEINRILKPGGVFIHFLASFLCGIEKIYSSRFAQYLRWNLNPLFKLRRTNWVRKIFGKGPVKKDFHFWCYPPEEIQKMLFNNNLKIVTNPEYFSVEAKLCEKFHFLAKNKAIHNNDFDLMDIAFSKRDEVIGKTGIFLSNFLRDYDPSLCSRSIGFLTSKIR